MSTPRGPEFVFPDPDDPHEAPGAAGPRATPRPRSPRRRLPVGQLVLLGLGAAVVLLGVGRLGHLLPSVSNPFAEKTVEQERPSVLKALNDLSRYQAASGEFQVTVDLEKDTRFLPPALAGERTVFSAVGSVDAYVDFVGMGEGAIAVSEDGRSVTVTLPRARLSEPHVDPERSFVVDRDRGLLNRLGGALTENPEGERELYLLAEEKVAAAAAEDDALVRRAEANTRAMLQGMLRSLGYADVNVVFEAPPQ